VAERQSALPGQATKEVRKVERIAKIDVDSYFKDGDASLLKREEAINELLLRLTVIVNSIADRVNDQALDKIVKRIEERVAKLEAITAGYVERGPGG